MYLLFLLCNISLLTHAQLPDEVTPQNKVEPTTNFMDLHANVHGDIFGNKMNIEELKGIDDFMSLVNKMDTTPEMKAKLTEQYLDYNNASDSETLSHRVYYENHLLQFLAHRR